MRFRRHDRIRHRDPPHPRASARTLSPRERAERVNYPLAIASTSASVGNRPSFCLENLRAPSTVISNTPPLERFSSTSAPASSRSFAPARRALGS